MSEAELKASYATKDCGFALQHPNVTNLRRDLTRNGLLLFPRKAVAAPGGGEYRYPHMVEMAVHLALSAFRIGAGKAVMWGLARTLQERGTKVINEMDDETRHAVIFGSSEFEPDDYPEHAPRDLAQLVDFPTIYFGESLISRDLANPTFLLFEPTADKDRPAKVILSEGISLAEAQKKLIAQSAASSGSDEHLALVEEMYDFVPAINLTTMLARIDSRLRLRLKASTIRGF